MERKEAGTSDAVRVAHRLRSYFLIPWGIDEMISPLLCGTYNFHHSVFHSLILGRSTTQRVSSKEDINKPFRTNDTAAPLAAKHLS